VLCITIDANKQKGTIMAKTTIQLHLLTGKKLKEISDKRKADAIYPSKQTEIITDFINKLHKKEIEQ
jgi:hypothetical protein